MSDLPEHIFSVDSVRRIDAAAINDARIGGYTLMTRAGTAALEAISERFPAAKRWQIVCGSGNNGGDGYVVARLAAEQGIAVSVLALSPPEKLVGDAATAYADFAALGGAVAPFDGSMDPAADLVVDGLLGSGLERDVEGHFADAVRAINAHDSPVVALDVPSGLHADSGAVMGVAVDAELTVTFVGLKSGLFLDDGPDYAGDIVFADLDIPEDCRTGEAPVMRRIGDAVLSRALPRRQRGDHKGIFGHVLVVGGGLGMPGAVRLCGEAALRAGAGLVSIATHPVNATQLPATRPELMCHAIESAERLAPLLERATTVAVGPGLGDSAWARDLFEAVLRAGRPLVVDADALNLLADTKTKHADWILTPHPGEAARLMGSTTGEIQADRPAALAALENRFGRTIVLKGAGTLVSSRSATPWLCTAGNPGMASAGMGDALTGIIAGLRAQSLPAGLAARAGVEVHARAGDAAASETASAA